MTYEVVVETVEDELIATVRVIVPPGGVGQAWKPALDQVWAFLRAHRELPRGHNLFLYHHPARRGEPMAVDFGVQVRARFEAAGNVRCVAVPAGQVARVIHRGSYDGLAEAHAAIHAWSTANDRTIGSASWETYGDWTDDSAQLETTIRYLLA